jgi:hypothetical protein
MLVFSGEDVGDGGLGKIQLEGDVFHPDHEGRSIG